MFHAEHYCQFQTVRTGQPQKIKGYTNSAKAFHLEHNKRIALGIPEDAKPDDWKPEAKSSNVPRGTLTQFLPVAVRLHPIMNRINVPRGTLLFFSRCRFHRPIW